MKTTSKNTTTGLIPLKHLQLPIRWGLIRDLSLLGAVLTVFTYGILDLIGSIGGFY